MRGCFSFEVSPVQEITFLVNLMENVFLRNFLRGVGDFSVKHE